MPKRIKGVYERNKGSNIWYIRYAGPNGEEKREMIGPKSAAIQAYADRKTAVRRGEKLPERVKVKPVTFAEIAQEGLNWAKVNKTAWKDDEIHLKYLLPSFGKRAADEIRTSDFERFLDALQVARGLSGATINRYRATLQLVYREAKRLDRVQNNPARDIQPRANSNHVIRFLTNDEERRLRAELNPLQWTEVLFAMLTGVRRGEQYRLLWSDVDLKEGTALIRDPKNGQPRYAQLHSKLIPLLEMLPGNRTGLVFPRQRAYNKGFHQTWFIEALKRAKIENFRWHDLRHTCASRLVQSGVDIRVVQDVVGHKSITTTTRYAHLRREDIKAAIETQMPVTMEQPEKRVRVN